jgi:tRNA(adenine34) deaminase
MERYVINHNKYMQLALCEAKKAEEKAEVPIGAVLVSQAGDILASSHNQTISLNDPTAHAEILVLREAAQKTQNYRLLNTIVYVTIEPCVMCMAALVHARISQLVFGARDPKWGGAGSLYDLAGDNRLNHRVEVIEGICGDECRTLMQDFFRSKR